MTSVTKMPSKNPIQGAVEIIPDRLYYAALKSQPRLDLTLTTSNNGEIKHLPIHFFSIDTELVYWNFFLDFGPLNLGQLYRFSKKLNQKLESAKLKDHVICFCSNTTTAKRANAMFLICAWQMLYMDRTPEEAFRGFRADDPDGMDVVPTSPARNESTPPPSPRTSIGNATVCDVPPFHDASPCACTFELTVLDCLRGLRKARMYGFFDYDTFNVEEYEYFEQVENGDLNWIVKDKIIAFAGPHYKRNISREGYCTLTPAHYIPYFRKHNIDLVVRLNKKCYEEKDFTRAGIDHFEQYYLDGSCPPMKVLQRILTAFERVPQNKGFAVHCKAGLGRTGTCIGAYIMKHYKFTAAEVIAWMRICRPGCVIGPQQHFLQEIEQRMWHEGDVMNLKPTQDAKLLRPSTPPYLKQQQEKEREVHVVSPRGKEEKSAKMGALHFDDLTMQDRRLQSPQEAMEEPKEAQGDELLSRRFQVQHTATKPKTSDLMDL